MNYKVVEKFVSVNGEGTKCGELAIFIRFAGCNLRCSYCDTMWANEKDVKFELMNENDIYNYIKDTKVKNVTLTGGEPLLQEGIEELLKLLSKDNELNIEIETNGSIDLHPFDNHRNNNISFTMDYKLSSSNMESEMKLDNFNILKSIDTIKFVVGSSDDLNRVETLIEKYDLTDVCNVYLSPVYGSIEMKDIVEFMKEKNMNKVKLQVQLHKIIWGKDEKGV